MRDLLWRLPVLNQLRRSGWFNERLRLGYGGYWGAFKTRDEALDFLRPSRRAVADDDEMAATMSPEAFSTIFHFDWPVAFFLSERFKAKAPPVVTDLGGHVGVKYYAFKTQMTYPEGLAWQIVDVPAICRAGRQRQTPQDAGLAYFESLEAARPCDVLLCSGAVQYLDHPLEETIRAMAKPEMILLNKVSVSETGPFYTLESLGKGRIPYHVTTLGDLDAMRERMGYRRLARWEIPDRVFEVGSQTGMRSMTMIGEAWRLDSAA